HLHSPSFDDRLRIAIADLLTARLEGGFRKARGAASAERLLEFVSDPRARTSFGNIHSYVLGLRARYDEAVAMIDASLRDAETYRLSFAKPYLHWTKALAELGLRKFARADRHLRVAETSAQATDNFHAELNGRALRARLLLSQHRVE